jgi:hypothetical protein
MGLGAFCVSRLGDRQRRYVGNVDLLLSMPEIIGGLYIEPEAWQSANRRGQPYCSSWSDRLLLVQDKIELIARHLHRVSDIVRSL